MFVNDTDVRMVRTKIRGGLSLVYNLYEMNGWETKSDFSIDPRSLVRWYGGPLRPFYFFSKPSILIESKFTISMKLHRDSKIISL